MSSLKLTLFGSPQGELNGERVTFTTRKSLALLVYVMLTKQSHTRETLATLFWPDFLADRAFANLRWTLQSLKHDLSDEWLDIRRHEVAIKEHPGLWVDVHEFQRQLDQGREHEHGPATACAACLPSLLSAIELYRGDFLRGFTLPDCPAFDEWQASQTDRYREQLINGFTHVIQYLASQHDFPHAIAYALRWVGVCPCSETAHRELMRVYALNHHRSAALQQYQACVRMLQDEFGTEPEHETQELYEMILNEELTPLIPHLTSPQERRPLPKGEGALLPLFLQDEGGFPSESIGGEVSPSPNNLPAQTTTFIGRETDIAAVEEMLLRPDTRLLTLTGPCGSGKTRLGLRVAEHLIEHFADGVFFIFLAPISNPDFVISAIVRTLELQTSGSTPALDLLKAYLKQKQILLALDNFEQILEASCLLIDLLAAAPDVKILVTSRTVLRVSGEHEYLVFPMTLPDPTTVSSLERLTQSEAVQLFAERAHAVRVDFTLTEDNTPTVADICTRLDGLPLAIELAAARVRIFSPQAILTRLDKPLDFLTVGARDLPARQQTLRNTIVWSYNLLDEKEKIVFRRLAVFVGGCTLEAAEVVGNISDDVDVLTSVEELVAHNLLTRVGGGDEPRFVMLETIREYAVERLVESGEADTMRQRHARFFLALAEEVEPKWHTREQVIWLRRFERELDNFRAALAWSLDHAIDVGLRLAGALGLFWDGGAYHQEGREWLAKTLADNQACGTENARLRAKALNRAGILAWFQGDFTTTYTSEEESAALCRMVDDRTGLAQALQWLGMAVFSQGDLTRARALVDESVALCRQIKHTRILADALFWHGWVARAQRDYEQARSDARECILLAQEVGDTSAVASGNRLLGFIAMAQGEYATAQSFHEKSLECYQEIAFQQGIPRALASLGEALYAQGHYERAKTCYQESLERFQKSGNEFTAVEPRGSLGFMALQQHRWHEAHTYFAESLNVYQKHLKKEGIAACLTGFAGLAEGQGQPERVAQLLGAASILLETLRDTSCFDDPIYQSDYERIIEAVRGALDEQAFAAAWAKGREMMLEQAIEYALAGFQQNSRNKT